MCLDVINQTWSPMFGRLTATIPWSFTLLTVHVVCRHGQHFRGLFTTTSSVSEPK